jgi:hypothetical protein
LHTRPDADLLVEIEERLNTTALYETDLATGNYSDEQEAARLRGGIGYEIHYIDLLMAELDRRERARGYGYRADRTPTDPDLAVRFARMRERGAERLADLISQVTQQPGEQRGGRWWFRCPFHGGGQERTASLTVYGDGYAHCFGCGWHGDGVAFVAEWKGIGMVEALRLLESEAV